MLEAQRTSLALLDCLLELVACKRPDRLLDGSDCVVDGDDRNDDFARLVKTEASDMKVPRIFLKLTSRFPSFGENL